MKKHIAILLLIFSINSFAQDKYWDKALSLYQTSQYQQAIEFSQKKLNKTQSKAGLYYIIGLSNFHLSQKTTKPADKSLKIKRAVNFIYQGLKYDKDSIYFRILYDELQNFKDSLTFYMQKAYKSSNNINARFFAQALASLYKDTTEIYHAIFDPKPKQSKLSIKEKHQSIIDQYQDNLNITDALGRKQGMWIKKYPNGTIKYMIYFKDGHPAGTFKRFYPNGQLQVDMKFEKTGHRAAAIFYNEEGQRIAMGYYYDKKRDSLWQFFVNDSLVIREITYKKGLKNGYERTYSYYYYPNLLRERYWKNDTLDSVAVDYFFDGTPKAFYTYKKGKLDGPYTLLYYGGKVKIKGQYINGYMEGKWIFYSPNAKADTVEYHLGKPTNPAITEAETKILKAIEESKSYYPEPKEMFKKQYGLEDW